jgi:mRNA interferase MazF
LKKGDIYLIDIPSQKGFEQFGSRPAAIIANVSPDIALIIPFTSNLKAKTFDNTLVIKPDDKNRLDRESVALIFQIRAIDKKRIANKLGELSESQIKEIDTILKGMLSI